MQKSAIEKAKRRIASCERAITGLTNSQSFDDFNHDWFVFLTAFKGVYEALRKGTQTNARSAQWFGAKKRERIDDPLLCYLYEARNDEEHGLDPVLTHNRGGVGIGVNRPGYSSSIYIRHLSIKDGQISVDATSNDGKPILIEVTPDTVQLQSVTARGNRKIPPPANHMGRPLHDPSPTTVASLGLTHLKRVVREAEALS